MAKCEGKKHEKGEKEMKKGKKPVLVVAISVKPKKGKK
jgi:hypothetical protein